MLPILLDTSVFIILGDFVKIGDERLVVLNKVAKSVIESLRNIHETYVFTYRESPLITCSIVVGNGQERILALTKYVCMIWNTHSDDAYEQPELVVLRRLNMN